jgi:hypothetical protein
LVFPNDTPARELVPPPGSVPNNNSTQPISALPVHLEVLLQKLTPSNQKYTFPTNTSKKNAKQLATYMFLLVITDVIKIASASQNFQFTSSSTPGNEQYDRFLKGKQLVDCGHGNPTCKGFWIKKGMNNFSKCLIVS